MPAERIHLENAKPDKLFYVLANVVVYRRSDRRVLLLQRDPREKVHPGRYGVLGGKLEWGDLDVSRPGRVNGDVLDYPDAVEALLKREAREEAGIEIGADLMYVNSVAYVRPDGTPSLMVKFAAEYLGGEVVLEEGGFVGYVWVNAEEARALPCIDGIPEEVAAVLDRLDLQLVRKGTGG